MTATGGRVRSFVRSGEALLCTRGMIGSRSSVYGKAYSRMYVYHAAVYITGIGVPSVSVPSVVLLYL